MTQNTEFTDEVVATTTPPEIAEEVQVEEVQVEAVASAPRKKRRFWPWLCVYTVLLLAVAAFSLRQLHTYLQTYESQTPNNTLTQFLNWIETKNYEEMYAHADFEETVLNTKAEYLRYLQRTYGEAKGALSLREQEGSSQEDKQWYTVYAGETPLSEVVLLKNPAWAETPFTIYTVCKPMEDITIIAQADTRVSINGTDLALLNLPAEEVQTTEFVGIPEGTELPTVHKYTIKGLLNPPQIEGLTLGGESCTVQTKEETIYYVSCPLSAEENEVYELAKQVMNDYMEFTARRLTAQEFKKYLYKPSDLYQTISNFTEYLEPKPLTFGCGAFEIKDDYSLTGQDFSCTVRFSHYRKQETPQGTIYADGVSAYRLTFFKIEGEWKLISVNRTDYGKL